MKRTLIILFFLIALKSFAQELYVENISAKLGLPSSETYELLQDRQGYIWIASDAGLSRYDGKNLKVFTTEDGLPENVILRIYEDHHGRVWGVTLSGFLAYYQGEKFIPIAANAELAKIYNLDTRGTLFIGEGDTIYYGSVGKQKIVKISPSDNYAHIHFIPQLNEDYITYIISNKLHGEQSIFGRQYKMKKLNDVYYLSINGRYREISYSNPTVAGVCWIKTDKHNNVYIYQGNLLIKLNKEGNEIGRFQSFKNRIQSINIDLDGNLWVGLYKSGAYLFKAGNINTEPIQIINNYSVNHILVDREGSVWLSTRDVGILKSSNKNVFYFDVQQTTTTNIQKKENSLDIFFENGVVWNFLPNKLELTQSKININEAAYIEASYVENDYRYISASSGLIYQQKNRSINVQDGDIVINAIKMIVQYSGDTVVASDYTGLYFLYNGKIIKTIRFPVLHYLKKLKNGDVIAGSRSNGGLFKITINGVQPYLSDMQDLKTRVNEIVEDNQGNLWIATNEKGVFCVSKTGILIHYTEKEGILSNKINTLDIDADQAIWLGTNKGLTKLVYASNIKERIIYNYDKSHGLPSLEINHLVFWDGKIWCGAKGIFFCFDYQKMQKNNVPPLVRINSITINNKQNALKNAYILKYDENDINIGFDGFTYKNTNRSEFIYKLIGYENEYKTSTTGIIQYTNLDPGTYQFVVYALNNDGVKSSEPATFNFTIEKPFWLWWWVVVLEVIVFIAVIGAIIYLITNRIRKREKERTFLNKQLAEFKMTAIRAQMNPHFIFNAISSIQDFILKNETYASYEYLAKFSLLVRKILNHSQHESISIAEEINVLQLYVELEKIRFEVPFETEFLIDPTIDQSKLFIPTMLIQPYVENAIWHGLMPKETDCKLTLSIEKEDEQLIIKIRDNGVGRKTQSKEESNGHQSMAMNLTAQRIEAMKRKNNQDFTVSVFDLETEQGDALGTEVMIRLALA